MAERHFVGYVPPFGEKVPGVYQYTHLETGKVYIGSTVNGYGRFIQHTSALERGDHPNRKFQKAFDQSPLFEVEFSRLPDSAAGDDPLLTVRKMEQKLIDKMDRSKLLNLATDVFSSGLGRSPSAETREKIAKAMTGRYVSEETRRKRAISQTGFRHTEEMKRQLSEMKADVSRPVMICGTVYSTAKDAAKALGFKSKHTVRNRCNSDRYPDHIYVDNLGQSPTL